MQCQNDTGRRNTEVNKDSMCTMATTQHQSTVFQSSIDPLSTNLTSDTGSIMDSKALSFMSKLFPDMSNSYSQSLSRGSVISHPVQTDHYGAQTNMEDGKSANHFPLFCGDPLVPTGLLPFGNFPFQAGMSNLAFAPSPVVTGVDSVHHLSDSRDPGASLNTNSTSASSGATMKTGSCSPHLFPHAMLNNNSSLSQLDSAIPGLHYSKKPSVNSATEIASLLQFSNLSNLSYPNFAAVDNSIKSKIANFPGGASTLSQTGKTDEDFCELCQKHFCNKYYLRKHKADVHGIHTEPYSHSRRRESLNAGVQKYCNTPQPLMMNNMERSGLQSSGTMNSNNFSTSKLATLNKTVNMTESDQLRSGSATPIPTSSGSANNVTEQFCTENGTTNNFLQPAVPMGANPMDYASVLKETFMLNALQSKISPTAGDQAVNTMLQPISSPPSIANNTLAAMNGMDSMLSAHYYMIALMSSLTPGVTHESTNRVENTSPQIDKNSMNEMFPILPSLDSGTSGIREVQCDQCHKVFCNQYFLQVHKANQHNSNNDASRDANTVMKTGDQKEGRIAANQCLDINRNYIKPSDLEVQSYVTTGEPIRVPESIDRSQTGGLNMTHSANLDGQSEVKMSTNSLDMFKNSMVAAKLADRVTCEFCKKELCNKYFLRTHKIRVHGVSPKDVGGPPMRNPPVVATSSNHNQQHQQQLQQEQASTVTAAITQNNTTGSIHSILDHSLLSRLSTASVMVGTDPMRNGVSRMGSNSNPPEFLRSGKSDPPSGPFNGLPFGLQPSPSHVPNPLMTLPYWSLLAPSLTESSSTSLVTSSPTALTVTPGPTNAPPNTVTTSSDTTTSQPVNVPFGELPALLPLGLGGPENQSATAVISCPVCEKSIGPRLYLPSHLTTVHGLNPLDPAFFLNMLRAKAISSESDVDKMVNGVEHQFDARTPPSGCTDSTMPTLVQEEIKQMFTTDDGNAASNVSAPSATTVSVKPPTVPFYNGPIASDTYVHNPSCDNAITSMPIRAQSANRSVSHTDPSVNLSKDSRPIDPELPDTRTAHDVMVPTAADISTTSTEIDINMNQCSNNDNSIGGGSTHTRGSTDSNNRTPPLTAHSATPLCSVETATSSGLLPLPTGLSSTHGMPSFPGSPMAATAAATAAAAAAAAAATAFSNFPMNPIEAMFAAMAAASGGQWNPNGQHINMQQGLSPIVYQCPSSGGATLSSSSTSPVLGSVAQTGGGNSSSSVTAGGSGLIPSSTGGMPRKSPNQMRVLCDICNKWICNKYFLRTHRANKHGITDTTSTVSSSLDMYKLNQSKLSGSRSQTCFRKSMLSMVDDSQTMPSPDTMESNSQGPNAIGNRSPKDPILIPMDTGADVDKVDAHGKFMQAWKMVYETGPQASRDTLGPAYPFSITGHLPPFINPVMMIPGFPTSPVLGPFGTGLGTNNLTQSPINCMLPLPRGSESPLNMGKSMELDYHTRAKKRPDQTEQDESSDILTSSMIQSVSPVDEKQANLKLHLPLNLSLKPSSTPLKKRNVKPNAEDLVSSSVHSTNASKRYLILGHLRRAKRFCLHSVWRKQQNQANKQLPRFSAVGPGGRSKRTVSHKDCHGQIKVTTINSLSDFKSTNPSLICTNVYPASMMMRQSTEISGTRTFTASQDSTVLDSILSCPLCLPTNPTKFHTLNPLLQHISLVHGGSALSTSPNISVEYTPMEAGVGNVGPVYSTCNKIIPSPIFARNLTSNIPAPTNTTTTNRTETDSSTEKLSCPFQVQQLASSDFSSKDSRSQNFLTTESKQQQQQQQQPQQQQQQQQSSGLSDQLPTSVSVSENNFHSPEPLTQTSNNLLHSIPVSATLHRPVFIPVNSYTETLSTI